MLDQEEGFRLSPQQEYLWLLQHSDQPYPYIAQCVIHLEGPTERALLRQALQRVIRRHQSLRTRFWSTPGMRFPLQMILDDATVEWQDIDRREMQPCTHAEELAALLRSSAELPVGFERDGVLRATLLSLSETVHTLVLTLPALCADTWSMCNLARELSREYGALHAGTDSDAGADDEIVQYIQFSEWQHELLEDEDRSGLDYWERHPALEAPELRLPFERPSDALFAPTRLVLALEPALSYRLAALARQAEVEPAIVVLAAWIALLWRIHERAEFAVYQAVANRTFEELRQCIGLLAITLPVWGAYDGRRSFRELLRQTRNHCDELAEWQSYAAAQLHRRPGGTTYAFESVDIPQTWQAGSTSFTLDRVYALADRFSARLVAEWRGEALTLALDYDPQRLPVPYARHLAEQLQVLLHDGIARPDCPIARLTMLSEHEQTRLLIAQNQTSRPRDTALPIHRAIAAHAAATPQQPALVYGEQQISFAELDARANQLAHHLQRLGVGPDRLVALSLERSPELVIGMLAVLKAGGAYVPIDLSYPQERRDYILRDSRAEVVITRTATVQLFDQQLARLVCLDQDAALIAQAPACAPADRSEPDHLAYVLYTSGSTGQPKGVMITHAGLTNYLTWCVAAYAVAEGRGAVVHSPLGFDLTITSLLAPLQAGRAALLLAEDQGVEALEPILRHSDGWSLLKLTPSHLDALSRFLPGEAVGGRAHALVIGGEALQGQQIAFWRTHAPATRLINEYGPTETVVGCCVYEVAEDDSLDEPVPIGRPIDNTRLYILDDHLDPVPVGVTGQLYIGGTGLARGYLGRPDLTAAAFVPNPFLKDEGARMKDEDSNFTLHPSSFRLYKTGDRARYRPDGNIEFVGRLDDQVKLRGFRIELGEIEAALGQHPAVREAAAMLREDTPGQKQLVAYVVLRPATQLTTDGLFQFVRDRLPPYMMPARFVLLDRLPITSNGKVDRRALPAPAAASARHYVAPRTAIEQRLADIWAEVLKCEQIGIHDNFFALGGDSILSIQVIARANQAGIPLISRHLITHQTIAELAAIGDQAPIMAEQGLVAGTLPPTPIQHWFFGLQAANPHHWNQALLLKARERLDIAIVERVLAFLLSHHDALRLRFSPGQGGWRAELPGEVPPPVCDYVNLAELPPAERPAALRAALQAAHAGLNITDGPLLRAALIDEAADLPSQLLLVAHHLATDGVSWRVLIEDFELLYEQAAQGRQLALPPKSTSFKQWAERLTEYATGAELRQEVPFWQAVQTQIVSAPRDMAAGQDANTEGHTRVITTALDAEATRALLTEVHQAYATQINDILLTAYARALAPWLGAGTIPLLLEGHGRADLFDDVDLSRTVGWFTTRFPVALRLPADGGLPSALKSIKEQLRGIPNGGFGYGVLRYLARDLPEAAALHSRPEPELAFNYLGRFDQMLGNTARLRELAADSGPARDPHSPRPSVIEITALIAGDQLQVQWSYSAGLHTQATIESLAQRYLEELRTLIQHCRTPEAQGHTPSDFPDAGLTQEQLDRLLETFGSDTEGM